MQNAAARRIEKAQRRASTGHSLPGPYGGWNSRDSWADMPAGDAVELINWVPQTSDIVVRNGYSKHVTGMPARTDSLMVYDSASASKMFAAAGTAFYDATSTGAVGAAVVSSLTNARWQSQNITTAGGSFMLCVNGEDKLRGYNGSTWWADGDGTHDITGVDTASISNIALHAHRIWLITEDSLKAWYLPTDSIAGAATAFDLSSVAMLGGYLVAMGTWTIDAGYGVDDMAVFITSQGEIIVYRGTDPSSASTWGKVGQWHLGSPIGRRCFVKWGGDLLLITFDGLVPLAQGLQSSRLDPRVNLTDKIRGAMTAATKRYPNNYGWQIVDYPKGSLLFLNVPVSTSAQEQYVMHTTTRSWCRFKGYSASCWALLNDEPYFGASDFIGQAWNTNADAGGDITASAVQAFSYFGSRGITKRWTMMRPVLQSNGTPTVLAGINTDFNTVAPTSSLNVAAPTSGTWGTSVWGTAKWGSGLTSTQTWQGVTGVGKCAGPTLEAAVNGQSLHWTATDFIYENGGLL